MDTILVFRTQKWDRWSAKIEGLLLAAERRRWNIQEVDASDKLENARELLSFWKPRGCVIVEGDAPLSKSYLSTFKRIPIVHLDMGSSPSDKRIIAIKHDARAIVKAAVKEFLAIGCSSFAYVGWPTRIHWSEDKRLALGDVLRPYTYPLAEFAPRDCPEINYSISLTDFIRDLEAGTGILCVNDTIAARVISITKSLGRSVPDELAVIGVDNDPLCQSISPQISSFALDFAAAGEAAMHAIECPKQCKCGTMYIPPLHFIRRRSTMRVRAKDASVATALEMMRKEACQGLAARDVTRLFACSRRMAEIKFRNVVGHSILTEIQRIRIERVCELLKLRDTPLQVLADMCGFRSGALLYRQFKATLGLTPRQWRKALYDGEPTGNY